VRLVVVEATRLVVVEARRLLLLEAGRLLLLVVDGGKNLPGGLVLRALPFLLFTSSLPERRTSLASWEICPLRPGSTWGGGALRCREVMVVGVSAPFRTDVSGGEQSLGSLSWSPFSTRKVRSFSLSWWLLWPANFCRTPSWRPVGGSMGSTGSRLEALRPFRPASGGGFMLIGLAGSCTEGRELALLSISSGSSDSWRTHTT